MKILVADIETTGFNKNSDCILELGLVELDLETGNIVELFDEVFKENHLSAKHRDAWIFENGYMTQEEVREAESLDFYRLQIQEIFNRYNHMSAWNSDFDTGFLLARGFRINNILPCPMKNSAKWFNLPYPNGQLGKWPNVEEAWSGLFSEAYTELHRGCDDAIHEAQIMFELYKQGVIWQFLAN